MGYSPGRTRACAAPQPLPLQRGRCGCMFMLASYSSILFLPPACAGVPVKA